MTRLKQLRGSGDLRRYNPAAAASKNPQKCENKCVFGIFVQLRSTSSIPRYQSRRSRPGAQNLPARGALDCFTINMGSSTLVNDSHIDALHLQRRRGSKMSTLAFYVLTPYGCSGLVQTLIPRHSLFCLALGPRYARLAAGVSQRAASLPRRGGSSSRRGRVPF